MEPEWSKTVSDESIWKKIEEHRAIPRAGWKLGAVTGFTLAWVCGFAYALHKMFEWAPEPTHSDQVTGMIVPSCLLIMAAVFVPMLMVWVAFKGNIAEWLRAYWQKCVRGYVVCWVVNADGGVTTYPVFPRGKGPKPDGIGFFLPLGGWLAKPRVTWIGQQTRWRVAWGLDTSPNDGMVCITDGSGMRMCMLITNALSIIAAHRARKPLQLDGTDMSFTWEDILIETREERDDTRRDISRVEASRRTISDELATTMLALTQEQAAHQRTREQGEIRERQLDIDRRLIADQRDAAQREAQEYRGRAVCAESQREITRNLYDETLAFLEGLVEQFEESGRCRTHLDSLRIQREVLTCLRHHSADPSPQFQHYSDALAIIAGQISDLERRDQKRHARRKQREVSEIA